MHILILTFKLRNLALTVLLAKPKPIYNWQGAGLLSKKSTFNHTLATRMELFRAEKQGRQCNERQLELLRQGEFNLQDSPILVKNGNRLFFTTEEDLDRLVHPRAADVRCTISNRTIVKPVIANCGHVFDEESIIGHLANNKQCPEPGCPQILLGYHVTLIPEGANIPSYDIAPRNVYVQRIANVVYLLFKKPNDDVVKIKVEDIGLDLANVPDNELVAVTKTFLDNPTYQPQLAANGLFPPLGLTDLQYDPHFAAKIQRYNKEQTRANTTLPPRGIEDIRKDLKGVRTLVHNSCSAFDNHLATIGLGTVINVLLGNTKVGKSSVINFYAGCEVIKEEVDADDELVQTVRLQFKNPVAATSSDELACTKVPQVHRVKNGVALCDQAGFEDTEGYRIRIINALVAAHTLRTINAKHQLCVLITLDYRKFKEALNLDEVHRWLESTFGSEFFDTARQNIMFVFTKTKKEGATRYLRSLPTSSKFNQLSWQTQQVIKFMIDDDRFIVCDPFVSGSINADLQQIQELPLLLRNPCVLYNRTITDLYTNAGNLREGIYRIGTNYFQIIAKQVVQLGLNKGQVVTREFTVNGANTLTSKQCMTLFENYQTPASKPFKQIGITAPSSAVATAEGNIRVLEQSVKDQYNELLGKITEVVTQKLIHVQYQFKYVKRLAELIKDAKGLIEQHRTLESLLCSSGELAKDYQQRDTKPYHRLYDVDSDVQLFDVIRPLTTHDLTTCKNEVVGVCNRKLAGTVSVMNFSITDTLEKYFGPIEQKIAQLPKALPAGTTLASLEPDFESIITPKQLADKFKQLKIDIDLSFLVDLHSMINDTFNNSLLATVDYTTKIIVEKSKQDHSKEILGNIEMIKLAYLAHIGSIQAKQKLAQAEEEFQETIKKNKFDNIVSFIVTTIRELATGIPRLTPIANNPDLLMRVSVTVANKAPRTLDWIPVVSAATGICGAFYRWFWKREFIKGSAELCAGIAGCFPGPGTIAALTISILLVVDDLRITFSDTDAFVLP